MELVWGKTLRAWLDDRVRHGDRTYQREVLQRLLEAGRGLQAAHEVGLVHRDFKPDNVLIGEDGRTRILDFGLARGASAPGAPGTLADDRTEGTGVQHASTLPPGGRDDEDPSAAPSIVALRQADRVFTTRGRIMGTPRYMSPEQMRGHEVDQRSDQFSFCVTLFEAFCGIMPFSGGTLGRLLRAVENGESREAPRGARLPAPVRKVLARGLAAEPGDRFPDMASLLAELEAWPGQRRRRMVAVAAVAAGAVSLYGATGQLDKAVCDDVDRRVVARWTPERRASIRDAFLRTGLSYAETSWAALEQDLDRYVRRLADELTIVCEATHEQRLQTAELLEKRMLCLTSRQQRLVALLDRLENAEAVAVERARRAAAELPELSTCAHAETLRHGMAAPAPHIQDEVNRIRTRLADARTQELLGRDEEALRIAREELAQSERLEYAPIRAEALYQLGRLLAYRGAQREEAEQGEALLHQARNLAESERHDELVAEVSNHLVLSAARNHSGTERVRAWYEQAIAAIKRIGDPPRLRADALRNIGRVSYKEGKFREARNYQLQALSLLASDPDAPSLLRGVYLHDLGTNTRMLGNHEEAQDAYEAALAIHLDELGDGHPHLATLRYDIAMLHLDRGDDESARELLEELLRRHVDTSGEAHRVPAQVHVALTDLERQRGALGRAHAHAAKSLELFTRIYGQDHVELAAAHLRLGAVVLQRGAYEEAHAAYEAVSTLTSRHLGPRHLDVGIARANLAEAAVALGRHAEALAALDQAESILAPHMEGFPMIAPFLASMRGRALLGAGRVEEAVQALQEALQGVAALEDMNRADTYWALAQALSAGGGQSERAEALARDALDIYEQQSAEMKTPADEVRRWLALARSRR